MTFLQLKVSIPSNGSIQFLHKMSVQENIIGTLSVSIPSNGSIQFLPYAGGQFLKWCSCLNPLKRVNSILTSSLWWYRNYQWSVSIPSNGSIQFLQVSKSLLQKSKAIRCLNPLKRVNSILTERRILLWLSTFLVRSQSPQTGQFNSYREFLAFPRGKHDDSLNPLKRVNSILTVSL